jgi:hypothetical protein
VAGGDTAVGVQMIATNCEAIGSCEADQPVVTAGGTTAITVFVAFGAATAVQKSLDTYYEAAKENQLCRLRDRLYPYDGHGDYYWPASPSH